MKLLYHGSAKQGLTTLNPARLSYRDDVKGNVVFASDSRAYSSAFTFFFTDKDEIDLGYVTHNGKAMPYHIGFPLGFDKRKLMQPCSIYLVEFKNFKKERKENCSICCYFKEFNNI